MSLLTSFLVLTTALQIAIIFSDSTDQSSIDFVLSDTYSSLLKSNLTIPVGIKKISKTYLSETILSEFDLLIDLTNNQLAKFQLQEISSNLNLPILSESLDPYFNPNEFCLHASNIQQIMAYSSILEYYGWNNILMISENENEFMKIANFILKLYDKFIIHLTLPADYSDQNIQNTLSRASREFALNIFIVLANQELSSSVEKALIQKNLLIQGTALIFHKRSSSAIQTLGALNIQQSGIQTTSSSDEIFGYALLQVLKKIEQEIQPNFYEKTSYVDILTILYPSHYRTQTIQIYNLREENVLIGSYQRILTINQTVLFPGPTYTPPKTETPIILMSVNGGSYNPGAQPSEQTPLKANGHLLALQHINSSRELLAFYQMESYILSCGASKFDYDYAEECLVSNSSNLGVAMIPSTSSDVTKGILGVLSDLQSDIPIVGCCNELQALESTQDFPYYARTTTSDKANARYFARYLDLLKIQKIGALYGDNNWGTGYHQHLSEQCLQLGISIQNPEQYRKINATYTLDDYNYFEQHFKYLYDTGVRYIFLAFLEPYVNYICDSLYKIGFRNGDIVILYPGSGINTQSMSSDDEETVKMREAIIAGTLLFRAAVYVGQEGQQIYQEMKSIQDPPFAYNCLYYDAAMIIANALEYIIQKGEDFNDPDILMDQIRQTQIWGCSGLVNFEQTTNDRSSMSYDISNMQYLSQSGTWQMVKVGNYNPFSSVILTIYSDFIWPDGSIIMPDQIRVTSSDCPFDQDKIVQNSQGKAVLYFVTIGVSIFSIAIIGWVCCKQWKNNVTPLDTEEFLAMNDVILFVSMPIEVVQLASLGMNFQNLFPLLYQGCETFALSINQYLKYIQGQYWTFFFIMAGGATAGMIIGIFFVVQQQTYMKIPLFKNIFYVFSFLFPIFNNILYVPFLVFLIENLKCIEGTGQSLTEGFLYIDCYIECWKNEHLIGGIIGSILIFLYMPSSVISRHKWQGEQSHIKVLIQPSFWLVKGIFQIIFINLSQLLAQQKEVTHGFLFMILLGLYMLYINKLKPYNYERACILKVTLLAFVFWLNLVTMIQIWVNHVITMFVILLVGWVFVLVFGGIKFFNQECYLKRQKDKNLVEFIRYIFSKQTPEEFQAQQKVCENDMLNI